MVWFGKTFIDFPVIKNSAYGDAIRLELLDGWKIELTMHNCPDKEEDHDCLLTHGDVFLARHLSIEELKQLKYACEALIKEYKE